MDAYPDIIRMSERRLIYASLKPTAPQQLYIQSVSVTLRLDDIPIATMTDVPIVQNSNGGWTTILSDQPEAWVLIRPIDLGLIVDKVYSLDYTITDNNGLVWVVNESLETGSNSGYWQSLHRQVRGLLRLASVIIDDSDINITIIQVLMTNSSIFPSGMTAFNARTLITGDESLMFERAIALMVAAWMRPFLPKTTSMGEVIQWTSGTDTYKWQGTPRKQTGPTVEEIWLDTAWGILSNLPTFSTIITSFQDVNTVFKAVGKRTGRPSPYLVSAYGSICRNPSFSTWTNWLSYGDCMPWSWSQWGGI